MNAANPRNPDTRVKKIATLRVWAAAVRDQATLLCTALDAWAAIDRLSRRPGGAANLDAGIQEAVDKLVEKIRRAT